MTLITQLVLTQLAVQVIYPLMRHEAAALQGKDSLKANFEALEVKLDALMKTVRLSYLTQREGGWDAVASWGDTLSLGEQQRIGLVSYNLLAVQCMCTQRCGYPT